MVMSLATRAVIPANTAKSLGAARARNGVGISETMMDFRALFTAANQSLDVDALQSLAEGWAEATEAAPPISCTDVYTGLATKAHFQRQIHEVSGLATGCQGAYALAVLSMPGHRGSHGYCWTQLALLGEAVKGQLRGTGATAMYQDSAIHILFPVSEENLSRVVQCKAALEAVEDAALTPVRIAFYPLASDAAAVPTVKAPVVSFFESN